MSTRTHVPLPDDLEYQEFFSYYLREHRKPATRAMHYVGTIAGTACLIGLIVTWNWWLLPLGFVLGYGAAWFSHFTIEFNKPAAFKYPWWSYLSDYRMLFLAMTGRLKPALRKAGIE